MATYDVAHIHQQGQDIIMVLVDREPTRAQMAALQYGATSAGLRGTVVPVWEQFGRPHFIAPHPWHPFFRSLSWDVILANVNRKLTIS
jgi:hypothetical protein